ncbi:hypothetical protein GGD63_001425 [Bradyrhizobium sp. cir1]|uniref:hypothetical protein n=1 Tax=Bradyrhizobium sp. cir1 TaxID=1445730 RepID=UPI001605D730|nr:hypothetical protein [Bradyrhizobium sp. cir1]MBB4368646.1 hypothetical protein [Bradyrhizobium sp. cir1]
MSEFNRPCRGWHFITIFVSTGRGYREMAPFDFRTRKSGLSNPARDFVMWNERAGGHPAPRVAVIVMTMAGSKSQLRAAPDRASRMYVERALSVAEKYAHLFDHENPADSVVITDDFVSSGRVSGAKSIAVSQLKTGNFHGGDAPAGEFGRRTLPG